MAVPALQPLILIWVMALEVWQASHMQGQLSLTHANTVYVWILSYRLQVSSDVYVGRIRNYGW